MRNLSRAVSWHRRKLAVVAAVAAVLTAVTAASPPDPPTVRVVQATAQIDGGTAVRARDVRVVALPAVAVPDGALTDPATVVGQTLTGPVAAGQVLTSLDALAGRRSVAAGRLIAPMRLADADVVALLRVGDLVDIVAADGQSGRASVVARRIRVVTIPQPPADDTGVVGGRSTGGALILVDVDASTATALARAAASAELSIVLH